MNAKELIDKKLRDRILIEIASAYPFSIDDIKAIYDRTGSFDETIVICHNAVMLGFGSLVYMSDFTLMCILNEH